MSIHAIAAKEYKSTNETEDAKDLWQVYSKAKNPLIKEKLLIKYLPLVKYVVGRMILTLPNSVNYDDLISAGTMGLLAAIDRFDIKMGVKFETYVVPRIRGSILDELRALDWVPRSVRSKTKRLERAILNIESQLGRMATAEEIAKELEMNLEEYEIMLSKVSDHAMMSLDREFYESNDTNGTLYDLVKNVKSEDPIREMEEEELQNILVDYLNGLPENEKLVLALYYYEDLTLKEIGTVMQVSESRVSQIHTKAIKRLRQKLKEFA
jgi:RNA polymerase sigma factor for flagellar operon FliA